MAVSFNFRILSFVSAPVIISSTYRLLVISSTSFGCLSLRLSRCCFKVAPNKNGDCTRPNSARVNLRTSISDVFLCLNQWNLNTSRSSGRMRTCRKACLRSPANATGFRRFLTNTSHKRFCRGGPVSKQSFSDGLLSLGLTDASNTIRVLVDSADSLITGLCGR